MATCPRDRPAQDRARLAHDRRRILHFNVTTYPTAEWTAQQIREAFPWKTAPRFLLRDRDRIYGKVFRACATAMDIDEVQITPQSSWQNPYVERVLGSIRRECLDHVIVFNERSLRRILLSYVAYHHHWRTHLALGKDAPIRRKVQRPMLGQVIEIPEVGGLHHHYERQAKRFAGSRAGLQVRSRTVRDITESCG